MSKKGKQSKRGVPKRDTRPNRRVGVHPIDPDANKYNNPEIRMCLIMPGDPELTAHWSTATIPAKRFILGRQHDKTHSTAKEAIYASIATTLSGFFEPFLGTKILEPDVQDGIDFLVDHFYKPTHIGEETFRFTIPSKAASNFTFAAVTKLLSQMPTKKGHTILCLVPEILIDQLLAITTCVLMDRPDDDVFAKKFLLNLANDPYSPIKRFSDACFVDHYGNWNSTITVFGVQNSETGESDNNNNS